MIISVNLAFRKESWKIFRTSGLRPLKTRNKNALKFSRNMKLWQQVVEQPYGTTFKETTDRYIRLSKKITVERA